jgi:hypothetical protein
MTSKSPVRACDDIDEATLSYAEVKALCAGDSRIKEKMDLDIEVSKLKLLKSNHQSQQYRMQDEFTMSLTLEDFGRDYILTLKGELSHRVELGKDARGNLIRIDNVLNQIPARIQSAQAQLENVRSQLETAKAEVGKPFPQEEELRIKSARLNELNAELNIDERTPIEKAADCEKPSVLEKLKTIQPQSGVKTQKTHEEAR